MKNKIKTIKVDCWQHQKLSEQVINIIQSARPTFEEIYDIDCVPKMDKPHFWEFWKWSSYNKECQRILNEVEKYSEKLYLEDHGIEQ